MAEADQKRVFVVYGRNVVAQQAMFGFLRRIGLAPIEWEQAVAATGKTAPYVGEILRSAFQIAQAVVVLLTPDEVAYLRPEYSEDASESQPGTQARPNVLFEAGMALGLHEDRTVIVELGELRQISDYAGRHAIRNINTGPGLKAVAERLRVAGCPIDLSGSDWMDSSQFALPPSASGDLPLGKRVVARTTTRPPVDVKWHSRSKGNGSFEVFNYSGQALLRLVVEPVGDPDAWSGGVQVAEAAPVARLPNGKSASFNAFAFRSPSNVDVRVKAVREDGSELDEEVFVNMRS